MMQLQNTTSSSKVAFVLSVFFALVLAMLSVADSIYYFWPEWLVLVLIFWCYTEPDRYGPLTGFILGILLDVLTVKTFGVLSLGLAFIAFFVNKTSHQTESNDHLATKPFSCTVFSDTKVDYRLGLRHDR